MSIFKIHTKESAAFELSPLFDEKQNDLNFVPNIFAVIAESVPALNAYVEMSNYFDRCSFNTTERETIEIVTSIENGCSYCVAGHSAFAQMKKVPSHIIEALRENQPIDDPRIEALANFTRRMIRSKGQVSQKELILFFDAGFSQAQLIEVVLGISLKFLTNFISNASSLPLDAAFEPYEWSKSNQHDNCSATAAQAT